ncbi:hypothetical protein BH24ACT5_BH24ACT5_06250 [soil metagenome]
MIRHHLALASGVLTAGSVVPYLVSIARGYTRPQRMTWFVFALLETIAAVSLISEGNELGALLAVGLAAGSTIIFIVSLWTGVGGSSRAGRSALAIALVGVVLSVRVGEPIVALAAVIVAIGLTVHKVRADPTSEAGALWAIDTFAGVLAIIAVSGPLGFELAYPVHHTVVSFAVLLTVTRSRSQVVLNPSGYRQAA